MKRNLKGILKCVMWSSFIAVAWGLCDVCHTENPVACHSETKYSVCIKDLPTHDYIFCPSSYVCTSDPRICVPKEQASPSCTKSNVKNRCDICSAPHRIFSCTNETTIAFCFGNNNPYPEAIAYCPENTVCDLDNEEDFCSNESQVEPSCKRGKETATTTMTTETPTTKMDEQAPKTTEVPSTATHTTITTKAPTTKTTTTSKAPTTKPTTTTEASTTTTTSTTKAPITKPTTTTKAPTTKPTTTTEALTTTPTTTTEAPTKTSTTTTKAPTTQPTPTTEAPTKTSTTTTKAPTTKLTTTTSAPTTTPITTTKATTTSAATTKPTTTTETPTTTPIPTIKTTMSPNIFCRNRKRGSYKMEGDTICKQFIFCYEIIQGKDKKMAGTISKCSGKDEYFDEIKRKCTIDKPANCD